MAREIEAVIFWNYDGMVGGVPAGVLTLRYSNQRYWQYLCRYSNQRYWQYLCRYSNQRYWQYLCRYSNQRYWQYTTSVQAHLQASIL